MVCVVKKATEEAKDLDMDMFYAQQARRIIDRLIGYKWLSPLLWKNVQSSMKKGASLSGGRVQSVVNRLIIEREREIAKFAQSAYFKTIGEFSVYLKERLFNSTVSHLFTGKSENGWCKEREDKLL